MQGAKAQANLELAKLIASWRDEARQAVSETLDKLPEMLKSTGLEPGLTAKLSKPLIGFRDYIDEENLPIRVAALSDRVALLVGDLRDAIMREMQKKQKPPKGPERAPPQKPIERVRVADVSLVRRVRNIEEWDRIRDKLDEKVKSILKKGKEVELV